LKPPVPPSLKTAARFVSLRQGNGGA
jgi:hypothetical protein